MVILFMKNINALINEFNGGLDGVGPILWHKKPHRNGSGDFACVKGIKCNCKNPVNCGNCYSDKTGGYCLEQHGESVNGFLAVEYKHYKLVEQNAPGAYSSIKEAIGDLK